MHFCDWNLSTRAVDSDRMFSIRTPLSLSVQESNRLQAAQCTGVLCCHLSDDQLTSVLRDTLLQADGESDWSLLQARATALSAAVEAAAARIEAVKMERDVVNAAVKFASSDRVSIPSTRTLFLFVLSSCSTLREENVDLNF